MGITIPNISKEERRKAQESFLKEFRDKIRHWRKIVQRNPSPETALLFILEIVKMLKKGEQIHSFLGLKDYEDIFKPIPINTANAEGWCELILCMLDLSYVQTMTGIRRSWMMDFVRKIIRHKGFLKKLKDKHVVELIFMTSKFQQESDLLSLMQGELLARHIKNPVLKKAILTDCRDRKDGK